ncbi:hypothetical protein K493DRAFT_412176 [Basidiobolus meristosporus CBS 931.73]|uniref:Cyclin N-terminal domain-containing protein n=1 Tax=Basidiobolus meristosporus CBS 931.73 TaxID=1314790 RepID=A0A1Y1X3A3_9FUNG|nr:hypothetical protein K493DRAFT_412176 [Basidiobolus meristosporus CBS 931.73]|eukprot:ORX80253.1 hypothetical protein K493DRAFT_412176 [Basidiobolus meristosporus CBS 931.73]
MIRTTFSEGSAPPSKPFDFSRADLINTLIDETVHFIQYIWPNDSSKAQGIPLKVFIQEILRRSHTSFSTLLTSLIYLFRLKTAVAKRSQSLGHESTSNTHNQWRCGRRMFLSALIAATKFLQDKGINNMVWSSLSGLDIREINTNERIFLELIEYNVFVSSALFSWWSNLLISKIDNSANIGGLVSVTHTRPKSPVETTPGHHNFRKKPKTNSYSYSPYPSLQHKCETKYHPNTSLYTGNTQFNIELSPPFLESSSSEDEE